MLHLTPDASSVCEEHGAHAFGFGVGVDRQLCYLGVPYWFLTVSSLVLLVLACRKGAKRKPGGAFPVELKRP